MVLFHITTSTITYQTGEAGGKGGGRQVPIPKISQTVGDSEICQFSAFKNRSAGGGVMPWTVLQLPPNRQISDRRLSKICEIIRRAT